MKGRGLEMISAGAAGLLFALGLGLSGMTRPDKVIGFLDLTGSWDPSLAFVMLGAVSVCFFFFRWTKRWPKPLLAEMFSGPTKTAIEPRLVLGAALFGVGWGLAGYCPGPVLVASAKGGSDALLFVATMALGMAIVGAVDRRAIPGSDAKASTANQAPANA